MPAGGCSGLPLTSGTRRSGRRRNSGGNWSDGSRATYDDGSGSGSTAPYLRRTRVQYPGPSSNNRTVVYANYPTSGDGAMLSRLDNLAPTTSGTPYAQFSYLGAGTIYKVAHPAVTATTNHLVLNYDPSGDGSYSGLDQFGQVVDQNWVVDSASVDRYQYGYDRNGNRLYRDNILSRSNGELYHANGPTAGYDGLDRLTDFRRGTLSASGSVLDTVTTASHTLNWSLDQLGNWVSNTTDGGPVQTRTHTAANEINGISGSWIVPGYDTAGNMTSGPQPGSESSNQLNLVYDAWNRVVAVTKTTGSGTGATTTSVATYVYNGLNQRIRKVDQTKSPNVTTDYYYNEAWQVLEEQQTMGTGSTTTYAQYVWDPRYIDAPVCRFRDANANPSDGLEETLYYTNDANFNVTALVNTNGHVVERYQYDAYGQVTFLVGAYDLSGTATSNDWGAGGSASIADNQILFGGYRYEPESGLYHVRNRFYHPSLGRWISRDQAIYIADINLYCYVHANTSGSTDPTGLYDWQNFAFSDEALESSLMVAFPHVEGQQCFFSHLQFMAAVFNKKGSVETHMPWLLQLTQSPGFGEKCSCCPDGSKAKYKFKQKGDFTNQQKGYQEIRHNGLDHDEHLLPGDRSQPPWRDQLGPIDDFATVKTDPIFNQPNKLWNAEAISAATQYPSDGLHSMYFLHDSPGWIFATPPKGFVAGTSVTGLWDFTIEAYQVCNGSEPSAPITTIKFALYLTGDYVNEASPSHPKGYDHWKFRPQYDATTMKASTP